MKRIQMIPTAPFPVLEKKKFVFFYRTVMNYHKKKDFFISAHYNIFGIIIANRIQMSRIATSTKLLYSL